METRIELFADNQWRPAALLSVDGARARLEYLPDYVFGAAPLPLSLRLPVTMDVVATRMDAPTSDLAFLWDLVPQGRGRQYLAALLGVSDQDPGLDLFLAQHGAYAPIGRLRMETAVRFYERQAHAAYADGFTIEQIATRDDDFLEQLTIHGMLAAGTPGVQGIAPKFLLTQDASGRWFPDAALDDARAHRHWIVKLARGRHANDFRILRHEAIYLRAAAACGLRVVADSDYRNDMLFLPRFDREVHEGRLLRLHQESLAALIGATGFNRRASLFSLTARIAEVTTDPAGEVIEFLRRDVINRALRNPDNHLRNTSLQETADGAVRLTPLYDLAPMYLDPDLIARTCNWTSEDGRTVQGWNAIIERLQVPTALKPRIARAMRDFGRHALPALPDRLREFGADQDIVDACRAATAVQVRQLEEIDADAEVQQDA